MKALYQFIITNYPSLGDQFFGNSILAYILAVVVFVVTYSVLLFIKRHFISKLHTLTAHTQTDIDDLFARIIEGVGKPFYFLLAFGLGVQMISQPHILQVFGLYLTWGVIIYTIVRAIQRIVQYFFDRSIKKRLVDDPRFDPSVVKLISRVTEWTVWVLAILFVAENLGYNVTALVAGLGIGGIAVAFALQNVLSDIFASISIYFDRPFATGDFIIVGSDMGVVKHIGIKSTRIQALSGEELVMSNQELTSARVHNYKLMEKRRIVFGFGVEYETPTKDVKEIPSMVREIFDAIDDADLDRVHFKEFGNFSLNFEVVYMVQNADYNRYMDIQQEINLELKERFEQKNIGFAYPTQTILLKK